MKNKSCVQNLTILIIIVLLHQIKLNLTISSEGLKYETKWEFKVEICNVIEWNS